MWKVGEGGLEETRGWDGDMSRDHKRYAHGSDRISLIVVAFPQNRCFVIHIAYHRAQSSAPHTPCTRLPSFLKGAVSTTTRSGPNTHAASVLAFEA